MAAVLRGSLLSREQFTPTTIFLPVSVAESRQEKQNTPFLPKGLEESLKILLRAAQTIPLMAGAVQGSLPHHASTGNRLSCTCTMHRQASNNQASNNIETLVVLLNIFTIPKIDRY
jgi:hypothetical protein